ncbi:MAG: sulfotransferase [Cyanobacteria bacterium J06629_9]
MKLAQEFIKLPWHFDVERLQLEAQAFAEPDWRAHPSGYAGNSAILLVSANGADNDDLAGAMLPTPQLQRCPYMQQVLASFNTVVGRSRLMRLAPQHSVPPHFDSSYYWFHRIRVHIPILTDPSVRFVCNGKSVHMAPGEAWIFDNWQMHEVIHNSDTYRIHLVFDTCGSASFWRRVAATSSAEANDSSPTAQKKWIPYRAAANVSLRTEKANVLPIADPSEVEVALKDLIQDLEASALNQSGVGAFRQLLTNHCHNWRSLWLVHGGNAAARWAYEELNVRTLAKMDNVGKGLRMASNNAPAYGVLKIRLTAMLRDSGATEAVAAAQSVPAQLGARQVRSHLTPTSSNTKNLQVAFRKPIFIVAAPRSGSTLLFETLSQSRSLWTVGGESHQQIESINKLNPANRDYHSNALSEADADSQTARKLMQNFVVSLVDSDGKRFLDLEEHPKKIRFLEKTPKNALRIPFLRKIFPNAKFIFLHRQPEANISSLMEAWKSGRFITYKKLPDWPGLSWSLILPPGWQNLKQAPLAEVAAFQWQSANQAILEALGLLPRSQWHSLSYEDFLEQPRIHVEQLCEFMEVPLDSRLARATARDLPHSRFTLTPPAADKWKQNADSLAPVLPQVQPLAESLKALAEEHVLASIR